MRRRDMLLLASAAAWAAWPTAPRAQATRQSPAGAAQTSPPTGPAAPIARLNDALLRIMRLGRATAFGQRAAVIRPVIEQAFDLTQILRVSVGLRWPTIPPAEQAKLLEVFTRYTVASYVANFDNYNGQRFEVLPQTRAVGADQVVTTRIVPRSGGDVTRIDYQMRHTAAGWQVVDVLVDGSISRVAVQRSDFRSLLSGGGAERLIASLERKVSNLQSGSS